MAAKRERSMETVRKTAVPKYRLPGKSVNRRIICNEHEWENAREQLLSKMSDYKVVGFDVECIGSHVLQHYIDLEEGEAEKLEIEKEAAATSSGYGTYGEYSNSSKPMVYPQKYRDCSSFDKLLDPETGDDENMSDDPEENYPPKKYVPKLPVPKHTKHHKEASVLIQLATWSGFVVMLRLCFWKKIPESLRQFLADSSILKVGVGINIDSNRLYEDWDLTVGGWIDLRHLAVQMSMNGDYEQRQMGLKKMADGLFGQMNTFPMSYKKMRALAWSDWNMGRLRPDQISYAAWDAQIAVDIFSLATQRLYNMAPPQKENRRYYENLKEKCANLIEKPATADRYGDEEDDDEFEGQDGIFQPMPSEVSSIAGEDEAILFADCRRYAEQTGNKGFATNGSETNSVYAGTSRTKECSALSMGLPTDVGKLKYCTVSMTAVNKKSVAILTINNPTANVLTFHTVKNLTQCLRFLGEKSDLRAVIITAPLLWKRFSIGFDLREFLNPDPRHLRNYWMAVQEMWLTIYRARFATVAAINGFCAGAGCIIAACCDRRVMASGVGPIGFNEVNIGVMFPSWVMHRLEQLLGYQQAENVFTRGMMLDAEAAVKFGLIDRVVSKDQLMEAARDEAEILMESPDYSRAQIKLLMRHKLITQASEEIATMSERLTEVIRQPRTQEIISRCMPSKHFHHKY